MVLRLTFTKGAGKLDRLVVESETAPPQAIDCPKQGIIPHDMVHYAVESVLYHRGFLAMVADGDPLAFTTTGGDSEEAIERLVETFQAELWGGPVPAEDLLATYHHACASRGHPAAPVSPDDVAAIRAWLAELGDQWAAVPIHGSLTVTL